MKPFRNLSESFIRPYWFTGFIALIVLLPLPFGANRPWASDLMGFVASLLLLGLCRDLYLARTFWPSGAPKGRLKTSLFLFLIVLLWAFLQTQSWMPQAWHHPLWQEAQMLPEAFAGSISIDPGMFSESFVRLMTYLFCFLLAFWGGREAVRAERFIKILAGTAVVYALYGLLMQSTGLRLILWYPKWAYEEFVTSTFVNKNSYAAYAGLGLQSCLAILWLYLKRLTSNIASRRPTRETLIEKLFTRDVYYFIAVIIVLGALILSGSRAGIVSSFAGCLAFLLALAINRRWRWTRWVPVAVIGLFLLLGLSLLNDTSFVDRLGQQQMKVDAPQRLAAYATALRAIGSNPWLGFGLGTFENAFRLYRDPSLPYWFLHAHNDYLEAALELGIPAAFLLIAAITLLVSCCVQGTWRRRREEIFPALALGATVSLGLHSFFDFGLQIPALAATYAALLGLGVAQSWSSRRAFADKS